MKGLGFGLGCCLALALAGCGDGGGGGDAATDGPQVMFRDSGLTGPRAFVEWRMRCNSGDCPAMDPPARGIDAQHLMDGATVECDLTIEGTDRRMNLSAMSPDGYGFRLAGARVPVTGGRIVDSFCEMRFFEPDDVDTIGPCTNNPPSPARPCQIQRVRIDDVDGVPTLTGEMRCETMQEVGDSRDLRDITSPTSASELATFTFTGCLGL